MEPLFLGEEPERRVVRAANGVVAVVRADYSDYEDGLICLDD